MTKAKRTPKGTSKRTAAGRAAVKKGYKFENDVADIYRLLGAHVTQNIEICSKKVDILAVFQLPGSATEHRVIIECKDEKKGQAQNQRVMEFKGLLDTARKAGDAESAEIITRVPWSDQAKGFAREASIELLTYEEKISQLIDFTLYLKDSIERFEKGDKRRPNEPPLGAYYVNPSAERNIGGDIEKFDNINEYIYKWLGEDEAGPHLAILGEYGTGKTSLAQKLGHDLAASCLKKHGSCRIPILFNLREFTKTLKMESLVTSFLDEECGVTNPRFRLFDAMNRAGIFLLIFDGFDEMAVKVDVDTLEINFQEIEKLAAAPKAKIMITCRLEYFVSGEEEKKALHPKGELLPTREIGYDIIKIVPWESTQIHDFLKRRIPLIKDAKHPWTYYRDRIEDVPSLADLSKRPVLLDMIVKTLPQLISGDKPINRPNLYDTYLRGEIKRQKIVKRRALLLPENKRFFLLERLALDFYTGDITLITFNDASQYIEKFVNPSKDELVAYTRDFLTCSFLIRDDDKYRFSHRSIMEYVIACALLKEIEADIPEALGFQRIDPVVADFLAELNPKEDILWKWIESTRSENKKSIEFLGGNAVTLLCMMDPSSLSGKDLSRTDLTGANLNGADLRGTNLSGTKMKKVNLVQARYLKDQILMSNIEDITVSIFMYGKFPKLWLGGKKDSDPHYNQPLHYFTNEIILKIKFFDPIRSLWGEDSERRFLSLIVGSIKGNRGIETIEDAIRSGGPIESSFIFDDKREEFFNAIPTSFVKDAESFI